MALFPGPTGGPFKALDESGFFPVIDPTLIPISDPAIPHEIDPSTLEAIEPHTVPPDAVVSGHTMVSPAPAKARRVKPRKGK